MSNEAHLRLPDAFEDKRVVVLGDFLFDQHLLGNPTRISREAPVVVIDRKGTATVSPEELFRVISVQPND